MNRESDFLLDLHWDLVEVTKWHEAAHAADPLHENPESLEWRNLESAHSRLEKNYEDFLWIFAEQLIPKIVETITRGMK